MAEELQSLLDRIQQDGVAKARAEADRMLADAKRKADAILADAKAAADTATREAGERATQFEARARNSLRQAARDVILSVGAAIDETAAGLVRDRVDARLSGDPLGAAVATAIKAYFETRGGSHAAVLLPAKEAEAVRRYLSREFAEALKGGLAIRAENSVISGFTLVEEGDRVSHTFTGEAIAAALCKLLRPDLADIVKQAMDSATDSKPVKE